MNRTASSQAPPTLIAFPARRAGNIRRVLRTRHVGRFVLAGLLAAAAAVLPATGWAQTGGVSGTGSLAAGDFFLGVQKVEGVNLTPADQARFLDRASCECKRTTWLRALLYPASAAKAVGVPATATVSMYLGNQCNTTLGLPSCLPLKSMPFSEFKLTGMQAPTSVDVIAKLYGSVGQTPGTGGSAGSDGTSGTGGTSGTSDASGCVGMITQTVWLLVETTPGLFDVASASLPLIVDGDPPPSPTKVTVAPANEALLVSWTAVDQTVTSDLAGYQLLCSRADQYQVFGDGTFNTPIDVCGSQTTDTPQLLPDLTPTAITDRNTHYLCSDFLSTSTTNYRLKILQNDIPYVVGVAAVDLRGNASLVTPVGPTKPEVTYDFYHAYRSGEPQGEATGGYCAVAGSTSGVELGAGAFVAGGLLLVAVTRRPGARRRRP